MTLPEPTFVFTIPSLHDGLLLDCRVYLPGSASDAANASASSVAEPWQRKAAILAHPYAPLGGCCDDPVVGAVGRGLLERGWVVGVFNFRGASTSPGHTSWTGKPELADYASFAGLMALYMHFVQAPTSTPSTQPTSPIAAATAANVSASAAGPSPDDLPIRLILGGYSYGSLIASRLPTPANTLLAPFLTPAPASPAAAIVTRARSLAAQTSAELFDREEIAAQQRSGKNGGARAAVVEGGAGEEAEAQNEATGPASAKTRRKSGGRSRSLDLKGVGRRLRRYSLGRQPSRSTTSTSTNTTIGAFPQLKPAYLLLSPLLPPTSLFIAPGFPRFRPADTPALLAAPGLAVYGDRDVFTSAERLGAWGLEVEKARVGSSGGGGFEARAIKGAGHFWIERGVLTELMRAVDVWAGGLG